MDRTIYIETTPLGNATVWWSFHTNEGLPEGRFPAEQFSHHRAVYQAVADESSRIVAYCRNGTIVGCHGVASRSNIRPSWYSVG